MVNPEQSPGEPPDDRDVDGEVDGEVDRHLHVDAESDEAASRYSINMTPEEAFSRAHAQKLKHLQEQEPEKPEE